MSTATKGHIYYIFKVNGADDVYKLGITNDIERRWNQHGVTKVTLVEAYCLGAGCVVVGVGMAPNAHIKVIPMSTPNTTLIVVYLASLIG